MKTLLLLCILTIQLYSQQSIDVQTDFTYHLLNKDNELLSKHRIPQAEDFDNDYSFSASYHFLFDEMTLKATLSYINSEMTSSHLLNTNETGNISGSLKIKLRQTHFPFDLTILEELNNSFHFGYGFSFNVMNRSHSMASKAPVGSEFSNFENSIIGYGIGVNGLFEYHTELNETLDFFAQSKMRFIYHPLYSSGENDTSDYHHYMLMFHAGLGLRYKF